MSEAQFPRYKCHKEVRAVKIVHVAGDTIVPEMGYAPFAVSAEYLEKHKPQAGGYYVRYADGYASYSPSKAFEDGYTPIDDDWKSRVINEKRELDDKLGKLKAFIDSEAIDKLPVTAREQLLEQHKIMERYSATLAERLMAAGV